MCEPSGRIPFRTFLRTWRNLAIASLPMGWMICFAAGAPAGYAWLILPVICLAGPFLLLLEDFESSAVPFVALCVVLYGLGVAWLFWKPSRWSRAVFIVLSGLWLLLGWTAASLGV